MIDFQQNFRTRRSAGPNRVRPCRQPPSAGAESAVATGQHCRARPATADSRSPDGLPYRWRSPRRRRQAGAARHHPRRRVVPYAWICRDRPGRRATAMQARLLLNRPVYCLGNSQIRLQGGFELNPPKEQTNMSRRAQRLVSGPPPRASQRRNARKVSAKVRKAEAKPKMPQ